MECDSLQEKDEQRKKNTIKISLTKYLQRNNKN